MDTTQTTLYHALLITGPILFLVIFGFCYTIFRSRQRYNNMMLTYMAEQIHSLERERARIAYDLHDDIGPLFATTRTVISAAGDAKTISKELVDKVCLNLDQANERMRSIVLDLSFSFLKRKGLAASLQDHFEQYKQEISPDIQFICELQTKINEDTELQLFRYRNSYTMLSNIQKPNSLPYTSKSGIKSSIYTAPTMALALTKLIGRIKKKEWGCEAFATGSRSWEAACVSTSRKERSICLKYQL